MLDSDQSVQTWDRFIQRADAEVEREFARQKADRLEYAQARLLADLNLEEDFTAWNRRRRRILNPRFSASRLSKAHLLGMGAMLAALAIGMSILAAGR